MDSFERIKATVCYWWFMRPGKSDSAFYAAKYEQGTKTNAEKAAKENDDSLFWELAWKHDHPDNALREEEERKLEPIRRARRIFEQKELLIKAQVKNLEYELSRGLERG